MGDSLQTKHRNGKWMVVCNQLSLMPLLGGTWPYVEARRLSLLVSVILVRIWPKLRLNLSLNPLSQCAITYGTVRQGVWWRSLVAPINSEGKRKEKEYIEEDTKMFSDKHYILLMTNKSQACARVSIQGRNCAFGETSNLWLWNISSTAKSVRMGSK